MQKTTGAAALLAVVMTLGLSGAASAGNVEPRVFQTEASQREPASREALVRECRQIARVIGPVGSYRVGGRELTAAELRDCNRFSVSISRPRN